jgi:hypothetical protein
MDLFKKPWEKRDPKKRLEGIKLCSDQDTLIKIASADKYLEIRQEALKKITNQQFLAQFALAINDDRLADTALNQLDAAFITALALQNQNEKIAVKCAREAVKKNGQEAVLLILSQGKSREAQQAAGEKLDDQNLMMKILGDKNLAYLHPAMRRACNSAPMMTQDLIMFLLLDYTGQEFRQSLNYLTGRLNDSGRIDLARKLKDRDEIEKKHGDKYYDDLAGALLNYCTPRYTESSDEILLILLDYPWAYTSSKRRLDILQSIKKDDSLDRALNSIAPRADLPAILKETQNDNVAIKIFDKIEKTLTKEALFDIFAAKCYNIKPALKILDKINDNEGLINLVCSKIVKDFGKWAGESQSGHLNLWGQPVIIAKAIAAKTDRPDLVALVFKELKTEYQRENALEILGIFDDKLKEKEKYDVKKACHYIGAFDGALLASWLRSYLQAQKERHQEIEEQWKGFFRYIAENKESHGDSYTDHSSDCSNDGHGDVFKDSKGLALRLPAYVGE